MKGKFYVILNRLNAIGQKEQIEEADFIALQKIQSLIINSYNDYKLNQVEFQTLYQMSSIMLHDTRVLLR